MAVGSLSFVLTLSHLHFKQDLQSFDDIALLATPLPTLSCSQIANSCAIGCDFSWHVTFIQGSLSDCSGPSSGSVVTLASAVVGDSLQGQRGKVCPVLLGCMEEAEWLKGTDLGLGLWGLLLPSL